MDRTPIWCIRRSAVRHTAFKSAPVRCIRGSPTLNDPKEATWLSQRSPHMQAITLQDNQCQCVQSVSRKQAASGDQKIYETTKRKPRSSSCSSSPAASRQVRPHQAQRQAGRAHGSGWRARGRGGPRTGPAGSPRTGSPSGPGPPSPPAAPAPRPAPPVPRPPGPPSSPATPAHQRRHSLRQCASSNGGGGGGGGGLGISAVATPAPAALGEAC